MGSAIKTISLTSPDFQKTKMLNNFKISETIRSVMSSIVRFNPSNVHQINVVFMVPGTLFRHSDSSLAAVLHYYFQM
jgi:hypothetical protein